MVLQRHTALESGMFRPLECYFHTKKGGNMIKGVGMKITAKDNDTQKRIKKWINF